MSLSVSNLSCPEFSAHSHCSQRGIQRRSQPLARLGESLSGRHMAQQPLTSSLPQSPTAQQIIQLTVTGPDLVFPCQGKKRNMIE